MDIKNLEEFENAVFNDEDIFKKFIEDCEASVISAPENFVSSVMLKINAKKAKKLIPFISRKMCAAICFSSAVAIMVMTTFGVNNKIFDFFSCVMDSEKIEKVGEFINQISFGLL